MDKICERYGDFVFGINRFFELVEEPDASRIHVIPRAILENNPRKWYAVMRDLGYSAEDDEYVGSDELTQKLEDYVNRNPMAVDEVAFGIRVINALDSHFSSNDVRFKNTDEKGVITYA